MPNRIRTAVIGTSWWADGAHLPGNSEFYVHIDTLKQHGICFVDRKG